MIEEIMKLMESIEYGFKDENNVNLVNDSKKWDEEFNDLYYLQTPQELLQSKCGVCWDQVELERELFNKNNLKTKTYFIYMADEDMLPSHTFLTYKRNNKFYWFEHSWQKYKGIHEYEEEKELLKDVMNKFRKDHQEVSKDSKVYLYEYQKPKDHITCNDFYKYIETQKLIEM